tara:strand:+ start:2084 stop:2239 length:156 start_codon:yes stop_codon:yes gene_type:complete
MKGDNLTYWRNILKQRIVDLALEESRGEDDTLIRLLKLQITEAENRIAELE